MNYLPKLLLVIGITTIPQLAFSISETGAKSANQNFISIDSRNMHLANKVKNMTLIESEEFEYEEKHTDEWGRSVFNC